MAWPVVMMESWRDFVELAEFVTGLSHSVVNNGYVFRGQSNQEHNLEPSLVRILLGKLDLRLMSWGNGSEVPTSGSKLVVVGTDNNDVLHIRSFDATGNRVTDTDEAKLPEAQAAAIKTLKQQLPTLLPPHVLTNAEKAQVIGELTSIVGPILHGLDSATALALEQRAVEEFRAQAVLHLPTNIFQRPADCLSWWSLMQHYSAPTRLLDWTKSPFVAAYFAVEKEPDRDGAVWLYSHTLVELHGLTLLGAARPPDRDEAVEAFYRHPDPPAQLFLFERREKMDRMIAQQGMFTVCRKLLVDQATLIDKVLGPLPIGDIQYLKVIIPAHLKGVFLARLRAMNISADALFPGIDGVGRSVSELIRLARVPFGRDSPPAMLHLGDIAGFVPAPPGTPGTPPTGR